jgi:nucleotide-binding universal stress UspA family protein
MKNILVPIDFSIYSLSAAKTAVAIAVKSGGNIHLLHLADIPVGWDKLPVATQQEYPLLEGRLVEAKIKLEKFSKLLLFKNCNVITYVQGGVAFEQINIFAKRNKTTLIVMGVHGAGESELKFIGSTAQRVMRTAPCPVLGVKKNFNLGGIKKILFASDFDEDVSGAINTIKNLADAFGANIDLAYINTPGHFVDDTTMQARMQKFEIIQKKVKFHRVIQNSNEKEEGILECAIRRGTTIIAMVTHLRKQKADYLVGVTESVLFHSKVPVLSFVIDESRYQIK